ncbi:MAG: SDR family NAD(P)-dependent oxidoreductase, partial [Ilumatobacteraceae bacterium]
GRACSTELARRGLNVLLVARRAAPLDVRADALRSGFGVDVVTAAVDMSSPDAVTAIAEVLGTREVGMVIANAASVPIGKFGDIDPDDLDRAIAVNCSGTLRLARHFLPAMAQRRRGGFVVMASMAGLQGTPMLATYAATKAFDLVLAEGLWHEYHHTGVHVVGSCAGAIADLNLAQVTHKRAVGTLSPEAVVTETFAALGKGPRVVPGRTNRVAAALMSRLLPRRTAVGIMARNTGDLRRPE